MKYWPRQFNLISAPSFQNHKCNRWNIIGKKKGTTGCWQMDIKVNQHLHIDIRWHRRGLPFRGMLLTHLANRQLAENRFHLILKMKSMLLISNLLTASTSWRGCSNSCFNNNTRTTNQTKKIPIVDWWVQEEKHEWCDRDGKWWVILSYACMLTLRTNNIHKILPYLRKPQPQNPQPRKPLSQKPQPLSQKSQPQKPQLLLRWNIIQVLLKLLLTMRN